MTWKLSPREKQFSTLFVDQLWKVKIFDSLTELEVPEFGIMGTKCKGCCSCLLFIFTTVFVYRLSLPVFLEGLDPEGPALQSDSRDAPKAERSYVGGKHLVCHTFQGGLGSLLFQYASATGIAARQGRIVVAEGTGSWEEAETEEPDGELDEIQIDEDDGRQARGRKGALLLERVLKTTNFKHARTQCRSVVRVTESACCRLDERLTKLDRGKNYEISGQLQSWKYFTEDLENVRTLLEFKDSIVARAKKKLALSLAAANVSSLSNAAAVGVHVRRGENLHWEAVDAGVRVAPREYFLKAMRHFRKNIQGPVVFIVVTDDPEWCLSNLMGLPGVVLVGEKRKQGDKRSRADYNIRKYQADTAGLGGRGRHRRDTASLSKQRKDRDKQEEGELVGGGIYLDGTHLHNNNHHQHGDDAGDEIDDALEEAAVDLTVLSMVDHSIISVGAFSWWAGFLARGTVIYYGNFVDADSKLRSQFDDKMADYVLPGWIKMT